MTKQPVERWRGYHQSREFLYWRDSEDLYAHVISYELPLFRHLFPIISSPRTCVVLDIGCGTGSIMRYFGKIFPNKEFVGIDWLADVLVRGQSSNVHLICADARNLPIRASSVDVVVSLGLMEHFSEHKKILSKIKILLRKGGFLFLTIPNARRMDWAFYKYVEELIFHLLGKSKFKPQLKKSGSRLITSFYGYEERWTWNYLTRMAEELGFRTLKLFGLQLFAPPPLFGFLPKQLRILIYKLFCRNTADERSGLMLGGIFLLEDL